uniref:Uncharacterized protein n=1 Tax=Romanomermis culicivorax TaxID=13658 RepID=A0A915IV54_ROMCU
MYGSCQSRAAGLAYTIAKAVLQDKKDPEPKYANIQVWKKETDNTDPRIRFWEVIDRKKAYDKVGVEKNLKKKVGYRVRHAYNRPAMSKTPDKDRKWKHESQHRDKSRQEKSMSKEKKRRENEEESWRKEIEKYEESYERKQKDKRDSKENKDSQKWQSRKRTLGYYQQDDRLDVSYSS